MPKNKNVSDVTPTIDSLEVLTQYKSQLQAEMDTSEEQLATIWNEMFRSPTAEELNSPTKRIMATITSASALIDGALLGWKLYRRFGGALKLFSRKKAK